MNKINNLVWYRRVEDTIRYRVEKQVYESVNKLRRDISDEVDKQVYANVNYKIREISTDLNISLYDILLKIKNKI